MQTGTLRIISIRLLKIAALFVGVSAVLASAARAGAGFDGTVAAIRARLTAECGTVRYARLSPGEIMARLLPGELDALGTGFMHFELSAPAWVHVVIPTVKKGDPFWLESRGFKRDGDGGWMIGGGGYETWSRRFEAGHVGLGVPSLSAEPDVYSVVITADAPGGPVPRVGNLAPEKLALAKVAENGPIYADSGRRAEKIPPRFPGATLIRGLNGRKAAGRLFRVYRLTEHPAAPSPDQVVLTWTGSPETTQTIRWRTAAGVTRGCAAFAPASAAAFAPAAAARVESVVTVLSSPDVANDPLVHLHTVELRGLKPGETYAYAVGDGSPAGWTRPKTFTTAPARARSFSFLYLGDAQNGFPTWGKLARSALKARPDAAFCLMAGDQVNRGAERDNWDAFLAQAATVFDRLTLAPAAGNHEYHGGAPRLYRRLFALRANGPDAVAPGLAYSFHYAGALFVVLDGNEGVAEQAPWLEQQLRDSPAAWKFVMCHQPAYAARPGRHYPGITVHWVPIFDRYHVDIVFQGHDHSYLRTHPMRAGRRAASPRDGTIYLITLSGTKTYEQGSHDYTEVGFQGVPTWQVIDLDIEKKQLRYQSRDIDGNLRDEFIIQK